MLIGVASLVQSSPLLPPALCYSADAVLELLYIYPRQLISQTRDCHAQLLSTQSTLPARLTHNQPPSEIDILTIAINTNRSCMGA